MMNKKLTSMLLCLIVLGSTLAQSVQTTQLTLDIEKTKTSCFTKSKYYFKSFNRTGEKALPALEESIEKNLISLSSAETNGGSYWMYKDWSYPVAEEAEADFTLSGEYIYNSGVNVGETVYHEKAGSVRLPYFVTAKEHKADIDVIFTFEYKDGSPSRKDTLSVHKKSIEKPGKSYYSTEKLEEQMERMIVAKVNSYKEFIDGKKVQINFPKVKIKDKALKAEYESIKGLLKDGDYQKAGSIVKKAYESNSTPEISQALGICYELVGNYPKAAEYYKALPNFHINTRMKKNNAILDFATSIGYEPEFIEF